MKKHTLFSLLSGCLLMATSYTVFANDMPTKTMQMSTVLQNLQNKGYTTIQKIEFENGQFEAKVINKQGWMEKLKINAQTGEILNTPKSSQKNMSALEVAKKVEANGYHSIYKVETEKHNEFEVKALDKTGNKVALEVNATTGNISKK